MEASVSDGDHRAPPRRRSDPGWRAARDPAADQLPRLRHRTRRPRAACAQLRLCQLRTSLPARRGRVGLTDRRRGIVAGALDRRPVPRPPQLDGAEALPGNRRDPSRRRPQRVGEDRHLHARRQAHMAGHVRFRFRRRNAFHRCGRTPRARHGAGGIVGRALRADLGIGGRPHAGRGPRSDAPRQGLRRRGPAGRGGRAVLLRPHRSDIRRHGCLARAAGRYQHRRAWRGHRLHRPAGDQAGHLRRPTSWIPERRVPACARPGRHGAAAHRAAAHARPSPGDVLMSVWEIVELARHPDRPYSLDYIRRLAPDFIELHGDRLAADDPALVGGIGTWHGRTTVFLGHQKGRTLKDRVARNWGMMHPEGYRKALRLAHHAAKFGFPIVSLIDTPGAYPGAGAEERGIAAAIATAIMDWFRIPVPIVAAVIGEGGSGGALGMAVADRVIMLENSIYSVAAPEAAASIVWRDPARKKDAAEQLHLTAPDLLELEVIDEIIAEPGGGAHTDHDEAARLLEAALWSNLEPLLEQ